MLGREKSRTESKTSSQDAPCTVSSLIEKQDCKKQPACYIHLQAARLRKNSNTLLERKEGEKRGTVVIFFHLHKR